MKTSSIAVETSRSTSQSDSIVRQTNKRSFPNILIDLKFSCRYLSFKEAQNINTWVLVRSEMMWLHMITGCQYYLSSEI